jgi:PRTRC genetic system protein B
MTGILKPTRVITIYEESGGTAYMEIADVDNDGKIGDFKALTYDEAIRFNKNIIEKNFNITVGVVPPGLFYFDYTDGHLIAVWATPAMCETLFFTKSLNIPSKEYAVPPLLWMWKGNELRIYALNTDHPTLESELFRAPFHNIYETNSVCMGAGMKAVKAQTTDLKTLMESVQRGFFKSEFTHLHNPDVLKPGINPNLFWKERAIKTDSFPVSELRSLSIVEKTTIGHLFNIKPKKHAKKRKGA